MLEVCCNRESSGYTSVKYADSQTSSAVGETRMIGSIGSVVFHSPGDLQASAIVHGIWKRPPAKLIIESDANGGFGNDVHDVCAQFIGWLHSQSPVPGSFAVISLPGVPWAAAAHDQWDWYDRVMAEFAAQETPPVLVDLDDFSVSHRGEILWPPPERRKRRKDRRSQLPGEPFPSGWYGQGLGEFRPGDTTYNFYSPEEVPPILVPLTGSFQWLRAAPKHSQSIAANPKRIAAALDRLLTASPTGLPQEFVKFFRSPSLWLRIQSCTDCGLNLDSTAVGIRDGYGTLIRFLSDSQGCKTWHLHTSPCGTRHSVVATYRYTGSEYAHLPDGLPHPKDITTCAGSFEEFVYRFWLENELWFALDDMGNVPVGGAEYLAFYQAQSPDA